MSVFSKHYWISKGYSEEEAGYQISIRRPNNINYYINKGHSLEESQLLVKQRQSKGGKTRSNLSDIEKRKLSPRCIEFWLEKGLTIDEARDKLASHQSTFTKEKCIKKYGEEQGLIIWQERQIKWQDTINSKSQEEKKVINEKKNYWNTKTEDDQNDIKNRMVATLKDTVSKRTIDEKRALGKKMSDTAIKHGLATPIENRNKFQEYRNQVGLETARQEVNLLENFYKRGPKEYHLDHKYSVFEGFKNDVPVEIIGHICNLEMLRYDENTSKGEKCSITLTELKELIKKHNDNT
jgi:hypothetical protein